MGSDRVRFLDSFGTPTCLFCFFLFSVYAAHVGATRQAAPDVEVRSAWTGIYTQAQAERGSAVYLRSCSKCHGADLVGDSAAEIPPLVGGGFMDRWDKESLADVFDRISTAMPGDKPGSLIDREYVDVMAYLLRANGFPIGTTELAADIGALKRVVLDRTPAQGK